MTKSEKLDAAIEALRSTLPLLSEADYGHLSFGIDEGFDLNIHLYEPDHEKIHSIRRALGVHKVEKRHYQIADTVAPTIEWRGETAYGEISIGVGNTCTIVGYEDKVIPAEAAKPERTVKKAIYKCT